MKKPVFRALSRANCRSEKKISLDSFLQIFARSSLRLACLSLVKSRSLFHFQFQWFNENSYTNSFNHGRFVEISLVIETFQMPSRPRLLQKVSRSRPRPWCWVSRAYAWI